jgi:hypothetical protein
MQALQIADENTQNSHFKVLLLFLNFLSNQTKIIKLQQKKLKKKQSRITFRAGDSPRIILQKTQSFR